jgi:predicted O-methyltransferase YrrM
VRAANGFDRAAGWRAALEALRRKADSLMRGRGARVLLKSLYQALPGNWTGALDYHLRPRLGVADHGALNDQLVRKQLFEALILRLRPDLIVETGTHRGRTTAYLARHAPRVASVEINARFFSFARRALKELHNVRVFKRNSVDFLRHDLPSLLHSDEMVFFYLDAHWPDYLPLRDEISAICDLVPRHMVIVDDFQVPGDGDYGYDRYSEDKHLTLGFVQDLLAERQMRAFFPRAKSSEETGARRGTVFLSATHEVLQVLRETPGFVAASDVGAH